MPDRYLLDTNLIVRYLVGDHGAHASAAAALFDACDRGEAVLCLLPEVLAECVFVLESFYKHPRADIARVLRTLVESPGVDMPDPDVHADALHRYATTKAHFVDCALAAHAASSDTQVATFDADLKRFPDVRVWKAPRTS